MNSSVTSVFLGSFFNTVYQEQRVRLWPCFTFAQTQTSVQPLWVALLQTSSTSTRADAYSDAKNIFLFLLPRSTVGSTSTGPKVWWRYCLISSPGRTRAPTRLSCGTAAPKTSLLWCLLIKVRYPQSDCRKNCCFESWWKRWKWKKRSTTYDKIWLRVIHECDVFFF